jgi:hypothetical protein
MYFYLHDNGNPLECLGTPTPEIHLLKLNAVVVIYLLGRKNKH